jgi:multisubunit Na+/H+ antiporter MnhB subunit
MRLVGLAALFAAGLLVAGVAADVVGAQTAETTTTTTVTQPTTETSTVEETTTVEQTTTAPGTTVLTTTTVEPATTATTESSGTETWVWVLLAVLGAAVIALAVLLLTRRSPALSDSERRVRLQGAIDSWAAQGWALTSHTTEPSR